MVAPDKSSVHPELMPADLERRDCFEAYSTALWDGLSAADIPGFIDLRSTLRQQSATSREPLYLRKDSHWDSAGSLAAVEAAVEAFSPGLWDDDEVEYGGLGEYTGDLTGLLGNPEVDQAPMYSVVRPDVTQVSMEVIDDIEGGFNRRWINSAPEGRLIPGRTLMFLDSYGLVAIPQFVPFFEDITVMRLVDFDPDRYVDLIGDADRVWFMTVERSASYRLEIEVGSTAFLDQLESGLGAQ
jgi:alginate O-acetyltransferase complex protein AlgJ